MNLEKIKELLDLGRDQIKSSHAGGDGVYYESFLDVYKENFPQNPFKEDCPGCFDSAFDLLESFYNKNIEIANRVQSDSQFKIKGNGTIVPTSGSKHLSNANMTDDDAFRLLATSENYIDAFEVFPSDWKEQLEKHVASKSEAAEKKAAADKAAREKLAKEAKAKAEADKKAAADKAKAAEKK